MQRSVSETRRSVATRPKVSISTCPAYVAVADASGYRRSTCTGSCSAAAGWACSPRWCCSRRPAGCSADWQLHRLEGRHARNHLIRDNAARARSRPPTRLLAVGRDPGTQTASGCPVRATGRWDVGAPAAGAATGPTRATSASTSSRRWCTDGRTRVLVEPRLGARRRRRRQRARRSRPPPGDGHRDRSAAPQRAAATDAAPATRPDHPHRRARHRTRPALRRVRRLPANSPGRTPKPAKAPRSIPATRAQRGPAPALRRPVDLVRADGLRRLRRAGPPRGR